MSDLIWFLLSLVIVAIAAYKQTTLLNATIGVAVVMIVGTLTGDIGLFGWIAFLILSIPLVNVDLRKTYISSKLFTFYKQVMPEMSETEQEAIDAGSVWWDGDIFTGKPNWNKLHAYAQPRLTAEEQAFLDGPCEEVCAMVDEWQINHKDADLSPEIWQYLKQNKFFAMIIKKQYGGLAFSNYAQSRVLQKLAGVSAVLSSTVGVPNSLGPGELLQHYGTKEQQDYYLPRLAVGDEIPCFALTSPEAGSDAGAIPDTGIVCKGQWKGEEILGMNLTFDKRYITLAPVATVIGLAFKMHDPDGLLGDTKDLGITCALIPRDTDGLDIGNRHFPLNVPFQNGPLRGENIFVPLDYIIGGQAMAGKGWRMLMECLSVGRCITLPSSAAGGGKSIALATGAYSRIRRQFRLPIGQMEGVEEMLARIGGNAYLMDAVTSMTTAALDTGEKPSVISAICKYHLTERMRTVINDSMDVHGGKGICLGPNNYIGRGYQGAPISITVEGANILTRNMMIFGQGAMRCHPYVLAEIKASQISDRKEALSEFDKAVFGHIGFAIGNTVRSLWFSLTGGRLSRAPFKDDTTRYYQLMQGYAANLAFLTDVSMGVLGGELKRRERLSARLGDILSNIYMASAALKRFDEQGRNQEDLPLLHWAMQDCLNKTETAIDDFLTNFPVKGLGIFMRAIVLPFGRRVDKPSDRVEHQIAHILQTPCAARDRIGYGQYTARVEGNIMGDLEQTLDDIIAIEPVFERICKALKQKRSFTQLASLAEEALSKGLIDEKEALLMRRAEAGRLRTINVDDFDPAELVAASTQKKPQPRAKAPKAVKAA
jgi:acyl-CoA dehydrogenase